MSDTLFRNATGSRTALRLRLCAVAGALVLLLGGLTAHLGLSTLGLVSGDVRAMARLPTVGDSLGINSDVKFRGMRIGRVVEVQHGEEPAAEILISEEHAEQVPMQVRARVLPGTLFGNEYVELVAADTGPADAQQAAAPKDTDDTGAAPGGEPISSGATIPADTSSPTVRLMETFEATQRLLGAIDPARLDTALSQLAGALDGRGPELSRFIADADALLADWARHEPQFYEDLELLATNVDTLADVEPRLVRTLQDSLPLARTVAERQQQTTRLMTRSTGLLGDLGGFLRARAGGLAGLLDAGAATLDVFAARHPAFEETLRKVPRVLRNGANAIRGSSIQMEGVLGTQFLDPYTSRDCPRYGRMAGPNCGSRG